MRFSNEHDSMRKIILKYWSILTGDPILGRLVTPKPQITYKKSRMRYYEKAGSIGNMLTQRETQKKTHVKPGAPTPVDPAHNVWL